MPLAALFSVIAVAFAGIAVWTATAGRWPIAACAGILCLWMLSLVYSVIRKSRA